MSCGESDPPKGDDDDQEKPAVSPGRGEKPVNDSALVAEKAEVVSIDQLRRRQRRGALETDPDPGDDPGPAAA